MSTDGEMSSKTLFSIFDVSRQVFYRSTGASFGIVNLKPLVPGHVLVVPERIVARIGDLRPEEVSDLFLTVQRVSKVVERAYKADALNVAIQDGAEAGQSVPHVHVHIIPRHRADFGDDKDAMYPALEANEAGLKDVLKNGQGGTHGDRRREAFKTPRDEDRIPRSEEEMAKEAAWLAGFFGESQ